MNWIIVYTDDAYESNHGTGFPCSLLEEAAKFPTQSAAEEHAKNLVDVKEIREIQNVGP